MKKIIAEKWIDFNIFLANKGTNTESVFGLALGMLFSYLSKDISKAIKVTNEKGGPMRLSNQSLVEKRTNLLTVEVDLVTLGVDARLEGKVFVEKEKEDGE